MKRFMPVMWFGFWLNAISGVALLIAYPTKALTNPVFYLKLVLIAFAIGLLRIISGRLFGDPTSASVRGGRLQPDNAAAAGTSVRLRSGEAVSLKVLAAASVVSWAGAITAGRFLAYTYTRLMAIF
jgi:hypothetical protein